MRPGVHEPTRSWLSDRRIDTWQWKDSRYEQTITTTIRELLDPDTDPALALVVRDAILSGAGRCLTARLIGDTPLWGYESCATPAPDLCLIDVSNQIRVVIEHTCGASPNAGSYPDFNALARFGDPLALSAPTRPDDLDDAPQAWGLGKLWQTDTPAASGSRPARISSCPR
jgi:hypothetical protein